MAGVKGKSGVYKRLAYHKEINRRSRLGIKHSKETRMKMSKIHMGRVVSQETREKIRTAHKGKKLSEEHKKKLSLSHIGKIVKHSGQFKKGFVPWNKDTKGFMKAWNKGKICPQMQKEHNHLWKGGTSRIYKTGYGSPQYREWRRSVFIRDEFTCQRCGKRQIYITAHHIKSFSKIVKENDIKNLQQALECKELWDVNNGMTLCEDCHSKIDKYRARFKIKKGVPIEDSGK
jgi:5-methylcytosine-specific restriction endonuclease McrA